MKKWKTGNLQKTLLEFPETQGVVSSMNCVSTLLFRLLPKNDKIQTPPKKLSEPYTLFRKAIYQCLSCWQWDILCAINVYGFYSKYTTITLRGFFFFCAFVYFLLLSFVTVQKTKHLILW